MNRILLLSVILVLAFTACKTTKQAAQPVANESATPPKVFSVPTENNANEQPAASEEPIRVTKEQVTFTQQTDRTENELNNYFVIIGSFSQLENAKNYRETLLNEGFTPIILHSETGYYRVCVNSYKNEGEARGRIAQIRQAFPKYSDVWLLIKE